MTYSRGGQMVSVGECGNYTPDPLQDWKMPRKYVNFFDVPSYLRYGYCLCGESWAKHYPGAG